MVASGCDGESELFGRGKTLVIQNRGALVLKRDLNAPHPAHCLDGTLHHARAPGTCHPNDFEMCSLHRHLHPRTLAANSTPEGSVSKLYIAALYADHCDGAMFAVHYFAGRRRPVNKVYSGLTTWSLRLLCGDGRCNPSDLRVAAAWHLLCEEVTSVVCYQKGQRALSSAGADSIQIAARDAQPFAAIALCVRAMCGLRTPGISPTDDRTPLRSCLPSQAKQALTKRAN